MGERIKRTLPMLLIMLFILAFAGTATAEPAVDKASTEKKEMVKLLFTDVEQNDSNILFINYLADRQIITGFPDGTYHPREGLSRAQAAVIIVKAAGLQTADLNNSSFSDVNSEYWAASYIAAASKAGYIKGFPDGTYQPEAKLTRAQGISLIMRLSTQEAREELPVLTDMPKNHWAANDMGTALAAGMIGLTADKSQIKPEAEMTRGGLARALATLLTKDPGLYVGNLTGIIKEVKGEIKVNRSGKNSTLRNGDPVYKEDIISSGKDSTASIVYPDGSSALIKENTEIYIKESLGRAYIKKDGTSGIAVEDLNLEIKKGNLFGALATKQETDSQEKKSARAEENLLASVDGLRHIAEKQASKNPPWYQQAEVKKVKMKVDMPYGVAAVRGTFILITVNQDGSCNVSCLTGNAEVSGTGGSTVALGGGLSSSVAQGGNTASPTPMTEQEKQQFGEVQLWVVNTAMQIDQNKEAAPPPAMEMILEIPDQPQTPAQAAEQIKNAIDLVLNALQSAGIQLSEQVKTELQQQLGREIEQAQQQSTVSSGTTDDTPSTTRSNATVPISIVLAAGSTNPVGGVTNVAIPVAGGTDTTGAVTGWISGTANVIKFTVTDAGNASSNITINGAAYTSGTDYTIATAASLTVVVTTTETGKLTGVRNFTISVSGAQAATVPISIVLAAGSTNPVGGVTNVAIPAAGGTDTTGAVTGWISGTANVIKFTVTDAGNASSTITINGAAYTSGADYTIATAVSLFIAVTTSEPGKVPGVRTFEVSVTAAPPITISITDNPVPGKLVYNSPITMTASRPLTNESWTNILNTIEANTGQGLNWITDIYDSYMSITPAPDGSSAQLLNADDCSRNGNINANFLIPANLVQDKSGNWAENDIIILAAYLVQVAQPSFDGPELFWDELSNCNSYDVRVYKNGTLVATQNVPARGYDIQSIVLANGAGSYTCTVQAKGDGVNYLDGLESQPSEAWDIVVLTAESAIAVGDVNPSIVITIQGTTFSEAVEDTTNWHIFTGDTGLSLGSIAKTAATQVTIVFTGTATLGEIQEIYINSYSEAYDGDAECLPLIVMILQPV